MKKLILKYGETIVKIYTILGFIGSIIIAFNAGQVGYFKSKDFFQALFAFLVVFFISSGVVFLTSFMIFCIIDIRDKVKESLEKKQ